MEKCRKMDVPPEMVDAYIADQMPWMDNSGRELHWTYRCLEPNGNEFVIDKKDEDKWELQTED